MPSNAGQHRTTLLGSGTATKAYPLPPVNGTITSTRFTFSVNLSTGFSKGKPHGDHPVTGSQNCSGTRYTISGVQTETVTLTITMNNGSLTLLSGLPSPSPVYITSPPACTTEELSIPFNYNPVELGVHIAIKMVTKKTVDVTYTPSAVGQIFGGSSREQAASSRSQPEATSPPLAHPNPPDDVNGGSSVKSPAEASPHVDQPANSKPGAKDSPAAPAKNPSKPEDSSLPPAPNGAAGEGEGISGQSGDSSEADNKASESHQNSKSGTQSSGGTQSGGTQSPGGTASSSETHSDTGSNGQPPSASDGSPAADEKAQSNESGDRSEYNSGSNAGGSAIELLPSTTSLHGVPIQIKPTEVIIDDYTIQAGVSPTTVTAHGEVFTVQPSQIIVAGETIPLIKADSDKSPPSATVDGIPLVQQDGRIVFGSKTFALKPSVSTFFYHGLSYRIDGSSLIAPTTTIAFAHDNAKPSVVTAGGQIFTVNPSQILAPDSTITRPYRHRTSSFVLNGQTFDINESELVAQSRTANDPLITEPPRTITADGLTFNLESSAIVLGAETYAFEGENFPSTIGYQGRVITIGSDGITLASTTIPFSMPRQTPSIITEGSLKVTLFPSSAIIAGHTYPLDRFASATSIIINGQTISIGPSGIGFAGTTVMLPEMAENIPTRDATRPSITVVDGISIALEASNVFISGTTYQTGQGSIPTTVGIGGDSLSVGPGGIGIIGVTASIASDIGNASSTSVGLASFNAGDSGAIRVSFTFTGTGWTFLWTALVVGLALCNSVI
ncbi:MAG: hypothetical protein Q9190_005142 [Brigantiaea leucoxantha]